MHNNLPTFNDLTDEALIQLVQNRNEAAFTELMFRYTPRIWPIIVKNSRQRQDAEYGMLRQVKIFIPSGDTIGVCNRSPFLQMARIWRVVVLMGQS